MQLCCSNYSLESPQISQFTNRNWTKKDEGIPLSMALLEHVSSLRKESSLTGPAAFRQDCKNWKHEVLHNLHSAVHWFLQSHNRKLGWSELPGKKLLCGPTDESRAHACRKSEAQSQTCRVKELAGELPSLLLCDYGTRQNYSSSSNSSMEIKKY